MDTGEDLYAGARVAYERIVAREAADDRIAWRTALMSHGRHTEDAFVLLHGLTASPAQFVEFGHMLHERGANVLIPRLPRHGHARMSSAYKTNAPPAPPLRQPRGSFFGAVRRPQSSGRARM